MLRETLTGTAGNLAGGRMDFVGRGVALIFSPSRKRNTNSTRESASVVILSGNVSLFVVVPSKKISDLVSLLSKKIRNVS